MSHLPSPREFALDFAMKLEEQFQNDSEVANPIVDESDWAPTTEQKPMKMENARDRWSAARGGTSLEGDQWA